VQLGDNRVVTGQNRIEGFPFAEIFTGKWGTNGGEGLTWITDGAMWVNRSLFTGEIRVTRVGDTEDHILFSVDLT
jgi:hypothetical protein